MVFLNQETLSAIGFVSTGVPVQVPLYILQRVETCYFNDVPIHLVYRQPPSLKNLSEIILQIVDYPKFLRYACKRKKMGTNFRFQLIIAFLQYTLKVYVTHHQILFNFSRCYIFLSIIVSDYNLIIIGLSPFLWTTLWFMDQLRALII